MPAHAARFMFHCCSRRVSQHAAAMLFLCITTPRVVVVRTLTGRGHDIAVCFTICLFISRYVCFTVCLFVRVFTMRSFVRYVSRYVCVLAFSFQPFSPDLDGFTIWAQAPKKYEDFRQNRGKSLLRPDFEFFIMRNAVDEEFESEK